MRVPSPPLREEKKSSIHVRLVETGSNASHTEGEHVDSSTDLQAELLIMADDDRTNQGKR